VSNTKTQNASFRKHFLDFEQPIAELEAKIDELNNVGFDNEINISEEISTLQGKSRKLTSSIFSSLSAWQISQLSRHPLRTYSLYFLGYVFEDFNELH
jgi:acetyl-CoA carboxylase carboxyl transferase subunit alpha